MAEPQSPRLKALQNLASQLPVANSRVAQGQQAARDIQLQQAVRAQPATASNIAQSAQQTGAAAAQSAGQQLIENAGTQLKQQGQVAQLGLQEQQQQAQAGIQGLQSGAKEQAMTNVQRLAGISEGAKQELYDKQMQFVKDEQGRALFNERQLADYARSAAKSDEEYRNYAQAATQTAQRSMEILEHSYNLMTKDLEQRIKLAEQQKDQKLALELAEMKRAAEEAMAKKRAKANNTTAMFQAGGTIVGAVAGAVIGGAGTAGAGAPAGAMIGASVGSAAGGMVGSQVASNDAK